MNSRITILIGISGSGKSTWAHEQWLADPMNVVLVSRDKIRELLFGYGEVGIKNYYNTDRVFSTEKIITQYEDVLINEALESGKDVIVDATHLKRTYLERFKYWNVTTEVKFFNTTIPQAIHRDMKRIRQVGDEIIKKQMNQYKTLFKDLEKNPIDFTPTTIIQTKGLPWAYIFDIDGTIAHMKGRSPYDWKKVCEDLPDEDVLGVLDTIWTTKHPKQPKIIICTGRDGIAEYETKKWLSRHSIGFDEFYIREQGDSRPDWVIKEEIWREITKRYYIAGMFDDRLQVVRRARALGLKVFNVEYNNF
jgi:predicted kinase